MIDVVRRRAEQQPDRPAYVFLLNGETEEAALTYAELDRRARAMAAWLQQQGLAGERVLLVHPPGLEYIIAFMGCLYAGVTAVPTYPPRLNRADPRLAAIVEDSQAAAALTTPSILSTLDQRVVHAPQMQTLRWLAGSGDAGLSDSWIDPNYTGDSIAFLQYTSGSTAAPRGVMVTHANVLHNAALIERTMEVSSDTRGLFWLPPYHDMGLVGAILGTAYTGITTMLMSPLAFLQRPVRWLQAIHRFGATHSGAPNFAYDLCVTKTTPEQRAALDLSAWRVAASGAEPVRHETLERFSAAFAPAGFRRGSFRPAYGLAEATLMVCCGAPAAAPRVEHVDAGALAEHRVVKLAHGSPQERPLVSSGQVPSGVEIVIVDPDAHTTCPAGHVGEIWVRGASVAAGYWNRPEESARVFGARVVETGEGPFLRTGDLGFVDDGDLFVTGRLKDLIILDGRNHYPQDIEATVERGVPAARAGGAAAFAVETGGAERLVVALEVDRAHRNGNVQHIVRLVRRVIADEHAISVGDVVLLRAGGVPKTSSGKIQRHACRAGYLASTLDVLDGPA